MGILSRFNDIMKSNINALLDKCEDPAKMVDQYLLDARKNLQTVKDETAGVMANEKAAQRAVDDCKTNIKRYEDAARNALKAGKEDDARTLLSSKQRYDSQLPGLEANLAAAQQQSAQLKQMYDHLTQQIQELEARKNTVKAKTATAKAQEAVNKAGASGSRAAAVGDAFARMEAKADQRLDKAMASAELDAGARSESDLLGKYAGGGPSDVEDQLAKMKAELFGGSDGQG